MKEFLRYCTTATAVMLLAACASIGTPDGGPYDETPPRITSCHPDQYQTNVKAKKITIDFDEFIKLEKVSEKVIVSPPQKEQPEIKVVGKRIQIQLFDSLLENTTYTIDFGDAIVDNNEGNPMGDFCYTFSTGDQIDTMQVGGYVLDASNLEPIKGIMVGLHSDLSDSAFTTKEFERVSRTDSRGYFSIKGLAQKEYRVYALQDMDQTLTWSQAGETWASSDVVFSPSSEQRIRLDSMMYDTINIDTILSVPYTHYLPDDLILLASVKKNVMQYMEKYERTQLNRLSLYFAMPADTLPVVQGLDFNSDSAFIIETSPDFDSIQYWIPDTLISFKDTLTMSVRYMAHDTAGVLKEKTDTLMFIPKKTRARILAEEKSKAEDNQKRIEKEIKKLDPVEDSVKIMNLLRPTKKFLNLTTNLKNKMDLTTVVEISYKEPVFGVDTANIRIQYTPDSVYQDMEYELYQDEWNPRVFYIYGAWRPGLKYKMLIDSASVYDMSSGLYNNKFSQDFDFQSEEEYSIFTVNVANSKPGYTVTMLNNSGEPYRSQKLENGTTTFFYVKPGTYWVRMWDDANDNGVWDAGDWALGTKPEDTWYMDRNFELKANWESETEYWDVNTVPRYKQKAEQITKQKADKEKTIKNRNMERAQEFKDRYTVPRKK